jgi:hypothetical protein
MGRKKNDFSTENITLTLIEPTCRYLDRLVATGQFGNNPAEVAKYIVLERIRQLIAEGKLVELAPMEPADNKAKR